MELLAALLVGRPLNILGIAAFFLACQFGGPRLGPTPLAWIVLDRQVRQEPVLDGGSELVELAVVRRIKK